jgi:hypothetical protein
VSQLERKKEVNSAFFYDFEVDDQGRLMRVFWADAMSRKNYSIFGDVVSLDATYTTNQYNMKFVPFTGVNHHLQSLFRHSLLMKRSSHMYGCSRSFLKPWEEQHLI